MVRGMAVILDVLGLLPDAEVVESGGSIKANCRPFLFGMKHHCSFYQETKLLILS